MLSRYAVVGLLMLVAHPQAANGQIGEQPTPPAASLDTRLLMSVYRIEHPVFAAGMYTADAVAYPAFYGAVPAAWLGAAFLREERDYRDAYRLTIAFVGSHASATLLKKVFRRPRPSAELADLRIRSVGQHEREQVQYEYSFPSGHAALAFALVTSYSLSHPRWYVIVPGFAWAATTGISRIWRGRHYPSDVVGGILLGSALAGAVHWAAPHITPGFLHDKKSPSSAVLLPVVLMVRF